MTTFLPQTAIEIVRPHRPEQLHAALFDYDGTLSLVRSGWRGYAIDFIVATLAALSPTEPRAHLAALATQQVDAFTGHPSGEVMAWLGEEVVRRGGQAQLPEVYVRAAYTPLRSVVAQRLDEVRAGRLAADELLVPGARAMLEVLHRRGLSLWLVSGSDRANLLLETELLGIAHYFGDHIYGPTPTGPRFTKRAVLRRLLADTGLDGANLVTFGDGAVETVEARAVGALVVGVAYDEEHGARWDQRKRAELIRDGADIVIPDYHDHCQLTRYLLPLA
jgi:phosphoglycolate phosphatase